MSRKLKKNVSFAVKCLLNIKEQSWSLIQHEPGANHPKNSQNEDRPSLKKGENQHQRSPPTSKHSRIAKLGALSKSGIHRANKYHTTAKSYTNILKRYKNPSHILKLLLLFLFYIILLHFIFTISPP